MYTATPKTLAVPFVWLGFQDEVVASQGFPAIDKVCLVVWKCSLH
jgi:hypothetical protein